MITLILALFISIAKAEGVAQTQAPAQMQAAQAAASQPPAQSMAQSNPPVIQRRQENEQMIDDALKMRDPFLKPEKLRAKVSTSDELETLSVEQIRMIGVVTGPKQVSALISANGKSYFVTVNSKIGPRKGVVRLITGKGMIVREKIMNILGREENVDTKIFIETDKRLGSPS